jgi:heat shock protein HtpX
MQFLKRIFLFALTNILVMISIGVLLYVLMQFFPALAQAGYGNLIILSGVWGFGGAIVSLLMSRVMAKWFQGVQVINPDMATGDERWLVQTVYKLAAEAGITTMPEVGIWDSPEVNAFCTGPSKNSALVAVSTGILARMSKDELEGVLGHELSHAANGDMVTMTLVQGVVNSFVIFFSFVIAQMLFRRDRDDDRGGFGRGMMEYMVRNVLQMVLSLIAYVAIIAPFSRWREFRADAGGARLAGKQKMIAALEALADSHRLPLPAGAAGDPALATMKIDSRQVQALFATHPSLEERIAALRAA